MSVRRLEDERRGGSSYDGRREIVVTSGEGDAMLDALFCLTDPGDEVILTDPSYAGMLNRVRLVGAEPRLVPLHVDEGEWRLDLDALTASATERTRVVFLNKASFPSGWVASEEEWAAVASLCRERDIWLLYGWVVAPGELVNDVSRVHIYNGLVPSGFAQIGALLLDVAELGLDCVDDSDRLLEHKVAATPMRGWSGEIADRHVRFVFSNEPVERLALLGERVRAALAAAGEGS
ncbi:MAG: aminotransferase class I/II-fold pyridoxal phosphate-dependent enzyme [Thermoleophilia bacterium]|nr:aminotransferase class I/II-fold pyridoxal phosphate-dependent enzyme [Thermoleophilia bacterium]